MVFLASASLGFAVSYDYRIDNNAYFDVETGTSSAVLNSSHDFKCTATASYARIVPVNGARAMVNSTYGGLITENKTSVLGAFWNQEAKELCFGCGAVYRYVYLVTNEGNYTRIESETASESKCEFNVWDAISTTPFFDGDTFPTDYQLASWTIEDAFQDDWVYISPYDLGVMKDYYAGAVIKYHGYEDKLYFFNSTESKSDTSIDKSGDLTELDEALIGSTCLISSGYSAVTEREAVAEPPTQLAIYCFNTTSNSGKPSAVVAWSVINRTDVRGLPFSGIELDMKMVWLNPSYFTIYNVDHDPTIPQPNTTVTISWTTTQVANSKIYWRSTEVYNNLSDESAYSGWSSKTIDESLATHSVTINNTYILEERFYQFWVESNSSGTVINDTNSGVYYNFSVGGVTLPGNYDPDLPGTKWENETLKPGAVVSEGTKDMATNLGITQIEMVYAFFFGILIMFAIATLWFTGNPVIGIGVIIVGIALFSLFGYLPYYLFILIALAFAFAMVKFFKGLFD